MPYIRILTLLTLSATFLVLTQSTRAADHDAAAGFSRIDITPDFPVRLNGYGARREEATGFDARIHVRAMAIRDTNGRLAVALTVDNCAVITPVTEEVYQRLSQVAPLKRERFVICSTHTHSAPTLTNSIAAIFGQTIPPDHQARIDLYTRQLIGQMVTVAMEAIGAMQPANLAWARGELGFAANRRAMKNDKWAGFGENPNGPVDHRVPALFATGPDGKLLGVFANYACHCTTTGGGANTIHGDWAGYAADRFEADHPGALALVAIGCGADQNPNPRGELAIAQTNGVALAELMHRLWEAGPKPLSANLHAGMANIDLPLETLPDRAHYQAIVDGSSERNAYWARRQLARLDSPQGLRTHVEDYPVTVWSFGDDLAMVFLGGEVVVDYALRLYRELDADRLWINAYTNDVPCYIPSRRILREGGYEADSSMMWYDQPTRFSPAVEDIVIDTVTDLTPTRFHRSK
ncbi:MAG: neutral/alkaline non-lysosomal ceramidase N-terminal domain-containing protein [Planctomycetota bacterium]|jgi:hypothetical protein